MEKRKSQARRKADVYISVYNPTERKQCDLKREKGAVLPNQRKVQRRENEGEIRVLTT